MRRKEAVAALVAGAVIVLALLTVFAIELSDNQAKSKQDIESRVHEFVPNSRIGWFGDGMGMQAYHTFLLLEAPEGCLVVTEEVVTGPGAVEFRKKDPGAMHRGHDLWLSSLQQLLEN